MNPLLDQVLVAAFVAGALGWFAWRSWRRRAGGKACGGGCGCEAKKR